MTSPVTQYLHTMLDAVRDQDSGERADYIEKLKNADPDKLALALCTICLLYTSDAADD